MESSNVSLLSHWLENGHVLFKDGFEIMEFRLILTRSHFNLNQHKS